MNGIIDSNQKIVSNGLVLNVDAAQLRSYPTTGTTWSDLSGNGINGTLTNTPTFNSANGGSIAFNGTNQYVVMQENSALNTQTLTLEVWFKANSTSQNGFLFEKGNVNTQYSLFIEGSNNTINFRQYLTNLSNFSTITIPTSTNINTTNWFQIVGTFTSGSRCIYINGVLKNSDTRTGTIATNTNGASIATYGGFNGSRGYYYNGNIGSVRVYNRVLSATEVAQNYNAIKSRFGL